VTKEVRLGHSVDSCRATAFVLKDLVGGLSQPYFITEQSVEVLELMFGFLSGFLTKFLLHFIDIHRYVSPASTIDYLCIRSFRELRAFAVGVFFDSSYPSCGRLSRPQTTPPFPPLLLHLGYRLGHWSFGERSPLSYFPSTFASLQELPVSNKKHSDAML